MPKTEKKQEELTPVEQQREEIRMAVRYLYDLQKLRISTGNRTFQLMSEEERAEEKAKLEYVDKDGKKKKRKKPPPSKKSTNQALEEVIQNLAGKTPELPTSEGPDFIPPHLSDEDKVVLRRHHLVLYGLELDQEKRVGELLQGFTIFPWLKDVKGCGPRMSGVLVSEVDITRCPTVSALWAYCGLAVDTETGAAVRRRRGVQAKWNHFLKTKLMGVLGPGLVKQNKEYKAIYDDYKHYISSKMVETCELCLGSGKVKKKKEDQDERDIEPADVNETEGVDKCYNCGGTGGPAPAGKSNAHRHQRAVRYMIKMFLKDLWIEWRTLEGLPAPDMYKEVAFQGASHGDHAGKGKALADKVQVNPRTGKSFKPTGTE